MSRQPKKKKASSSEPRSTSPLENELNKLWLHLDPPADNGSQVQNGATPQLPKHLTATIINSRMSVPITSDDEFLIARRSGLNLNWSQNTPGPSLDSSGIKVDVASSMNDQNAKPKSLIPNLPPAFLTHLDKIKQGTLIPGFELQNQKHQKLAEKQAKIAMMLVCRMAMLHGVQKKIVATQAKNNTEQKEIDAKQENVDAAQKKAYISDPRFIAEINPWKFTTLLKNMGHGFTEGGLKTLASLLLTIFGVLFIQGKLNQENIDAPVSYNDDGAGIASFAISLVVAAILTVFNAPMQYDFARRIQGPLTEREQQRIYFDLNTIPIFLLEKFGFAIDFEKGCMIFVTRDPSPIPTTPFGGSKNLITLQIRTYQGKEADEKKSNNQRSTDEKSILSIQWPQNSLPSLYTNNENPQLVKKPKELGQSIDNWIKEEAITPQRLNLPDITRSTRCSILDVTSSTRYSILAVFLTELLDGFAAGNVFLTTKALSFPNLIDSSKDRSVVFVITLLIGAMGGLIKAQSTLASLGFQTLIYRDAIGWFSTGRLSQLPQDRNKLIASSLTWFKTLTWALPLLYTGLHTLAITTTTMYPHLKYGLALFAALGPMVKTSRFDIRNTGLGLGLSLKEIRDPFKENWKNFLVKLMGANFESGWFALDSKWKLYLADASYALGLFFLAFAGLKNVYTRVILPWFTDSGASLEGLVANDILGDLLSPAGIVLLAIASLVVYPQTNQLHQVGLQEIKEHGKPSKEQAEDLEAENVEPENPDDPHTYTYTYGFGL